MLLTIIVSLRSLCSCAPRKGTLSSSSGPVLAAGPGVPRLPPGKKPPGPPPGPPPPQVLALYGIPARRSYGVDTGNIFFLFFLF